MVREDRDRLPFVTVVMPVRNEAAVLGASLRALLAGDYPPERMEVLVVDGGSEDGSRRIVADLATEDERVKLLDNPAGTTPAALNVGLREARGSVVVRLDGHAVPAPDYVSACVAALASTGCDAVGGMMVGRGRGPFGRAVALATTTRLGAGDASFRLGGEGPTDTVYLGAWPREVFDRVGGFDEGLSRNQDYELCVRIRAAGGTVWLDPRIRTVTEMRATPSALAKQYFGYGRGRAGTVVRHPSSLRLRQAVPAAAVLALAIGLPAAGFSRAVRVALAGAIGAYGALVGLTTFVAKRRLDLRSATALPAVFVIMHAAWGLGFWRGLLESLGERRSN